MQMIAKGLKQYKKGVILGPLFKLFEAVLELIVPLVMSQIIDIGVIGGNRTYVFIRGLLMLLLGILGFGAAMICQYYAARVGGGLGRSLRNETYAHVMKMAGKDVAGFGTGGLITRLTNDVNQVQSLVNMAIRLGSRVPFLALGSMIMAMRINLRIGMVFLAGTVLISLVLYAVMRKTLPGYAQVQSMQDGLSQSSAENLAGTRIIRAFSRQKDEQAAYSNAAEALTKATVRVGRLSAALNPLTSVIANAAIIVIVWLGARNVYDGSMTTGEIVALVSYMTQTLLALIVAANLAVLFTRGITSARRVSVVLNTPPGIVAEEIAETPAKAPDALLAFEDVRFAYHKEADDALEGLSFALRPGETLGVIGGTASGKSTMVNLIMRYYDVDGGSIRVDGRDIRALAPEALRRRIGLAPQSAVLLSGTVRQNLAMSAPDATEEDMWHALEVAQGAAFVREMPGGLDAVIQEGGKNLSGGQRQRLTIARALVRKPELLILDDATSALDYATDAAFRMALREEKQRFAGMSVLVIGQRVASIRHADQILVLDDGRLAGCGTHEVLLASNVVYQEICHTQGIRPEGA